MSGPGSRLAALIVLICGAPAWAGPPLVADDPNTVGPGNAELILAFTPLGLDSGVQWTGPIIDVTLGLFDGLDLTLAGTPIFESGESARGGLLLALKWQPIRGERFKAAFTPSADFAFSDGATPVNPVAGVAADFAIVLPVQLEYSFGRWAVGADLGYAIAIDAADGWISGLYTSVEVVNSLVLLAELAAEPGSSQGGTALFFTGGFDWATPLGFNLLASGSGTFHNTARDSAPGWRAFLGLQWAFGVWEPR